MRLAKHLDIFQKKRHTTQALQVIKIGLFINTKNLDSQLKLEYGENPLPISQFDEIYSENIGILILGMVI